MRFIYLLEYEDSFFIKNINNGSILECDNQVINDIDAKNIFLNKKYKKSINKVFNVTSNCKKDEITFVIVTNTDCNLECSYCYENNIFEKDYRMISENDDKVYNFIVKNVENSKCKNIFIEFTGGEPLMNKKFIFNIVNKLNKKFVDKKIFYSLVTNGTLLNINDANFFEYNNFIIQITLDGDKKYHNTERQGMHIDNSFDLILNNIKLFLEKTKYINFSLRININKQNQGSIFSLINKIIKLFSKYFNKNLSIYFSLVDVPLNDINYIDYLEGIQYIGKLYYILFKNNIKIPNRFNIAGNCMARNNNSVTILPDGNLVKCYSLVSESIFFNKLNINDISDIELIKPILSSCNKLNCPVYNLCMGGCGYKRFSIKNTFDVNCNYNSVNYLNKLLYILELITDLSLDISNPMEMVDDVKVKKICFK